MDTLLTCIGHAGFSGILLKGALRHEREALAIHLQALKAQGHAIVADEVFEHGEVSGDIRVTHYATCLKCVGAKP